LSTRNVSGYNARTPAEGVSPVDHVASYDPLCRPSACPPDVAAKSVYIDSADEIDRHKWIVCQKAGRDLGEEAVRDWVRNHWGGYLRAKWMEHLQGVCYWMELDHGDFGLLKREFPVDADLLNVIVGKLKAGEENLDVIRWAIDSHLPLNPVIHILEALDVNSRRLVHQFDAA
jgi:hypothetical protein